MYFSFRSDGAGCILHRNVGGNFYQHSFFGIRTLGRRTLGRRTLQGWRTLGRRTLGRMTLGRKTGKQTLRRIWALALNPIP